MGNGNLADDINTMAGIFAKPFASVFLSKSSGDLSSVQFHPNKVLHKIFWCWQQHGTRQSSSLSMQECAMELACSFPVFNMRSDFLSQSWKLSHIVFPVYEKESQGTPLNYRPIGLNPISCKTMERIIHKVLFSFTDHQLWWVTIWSIGMIRSCGWFNPIWLCFKTLDHVHYQTFIDKTFYSGSYLFWVGQWKVQSMVTIPLKT